MFLYSLRVSETLLILRGIQRDIIVRLHQFSCKVPFIIVGSYANLNFLARFSNGAESFHADGLTDMTKLNVAFRDFPKAPKMRRVNYIE
jgi:hypothetical protein